MPVDEKAITSQIDEILDQYESMRQASQYSDCSDRGEVEVTAMVSALAAAIDRVAPAGSRYLKLQETIFDTHTPHNGRALAPLAGILKSIRSDLSAGRFATVTELLHADVFSDFLDMAQHLLEEGYKDPAAVLVGGVLEEHLRKLCVKHAVIPTSGTKPKRADTMNADLAAIPAYSKTDQKNVTAWLGLRNEAAHGQYGKYTQDQVALLVQSVRDFITRVPA